MADKKSTEIVKDEVVTINLQPFLMPIAIVLSSLIFATGMFAGLNNIATSIKGVNITTGSTTPPTTTPPAQVTVSLDKIKSLFQGNNMKFGDDSRKVLFVEFSDPSCPYCHIAGGKNSELNKQAGSQFLLVKDGGSYVAPVEEMKKLVDEGKASFVWLYTNGHGNGEMGTKAMYCAYEKGKFWEVHDILMNATGYDKLNNSIKNDKSKSGELADMLSSAVNANDMKACLDSGKYDSRITEDAAVGASLGISGTPGFFVNETNFAGAYSYTDMKSTVDKALQ